MLSPLLMLALASAAPLRGQEGETIRRIEVLGAVKLTPETVIFRSGLKVGDDLRNIDLTAVLEKLWATGTYDDIKFEVEDEPGGKRLVIRVMERPLIKEVDYRGGTELGVTIIKDKVKEKKLELKTDSVYDPESARKIKSLIVEQAAEKGFRNPVVAISLEPMGPGIARLVFDIKEGGKARIYKIAFRGAKLFSNRQLEKAMEKTRKHWMFSWVTSHDLLVDKNMDEDLKRIKELYWRNGYKDVFVGQPVIDVQDRTTAAIRKKNEKRLKKGQSPKYDLRATLTIPILEGEKFYEGRLKLEGNDKLFNERFFRLKIAEAKRDNRSWLAKFLNLKPNTEDLPDNKRRPFDLDALNKGLDKVKEAYADQSYIAFRADKKLDVRDEGGLKKVDVTLKVDEGEAFTIRRISFEGNTTTKDKVLRRSMLLKEGDPFGAASFKDSYTGLGQLGFFDVKAQEPKVDFVPDKPQVDITIKGEESGVNEILFQGGYGSLFGFSLGLSFSTKNLGGGGETLSFAYNGGKFQRNFSVAFTEPYVFDLPYSFGASIANGATEYDASRVGADLAYKQFTRSLGISTGTRLSTFLANRSAWAFFTTVGVGYNFSIVKIAGGRNFAFRGHQQPAHLHLQHERGVLHGQPPLQAHGGHEAGRGPGIRRLAVRHRQALHAGDLRLQQVRQHRGSPHLRLQRQLRLPAQPQFGRAALLPVLPSRRGEHHPRLPLRAGGLAHLRQPQPAGHRGRQQAAHPERGIPVQDRRPVPDGALLRRRQRLGPRDEGLLPPPGALLRERAGPLLHGPGPAPLRRPGTPLLPPHQPGAAAADLEPEAESLSLRYRKPQRLPVLHRHDLLGPGQGLPCRNGSRSSQAFQ
ncbi:MAG: BamA/TamA family outer membrane protein [Holophagaceae bacterium]|nr:BamA/TamA family outer membrane protein [Holophagaceae bacterium]